MRTFLGGRFASVREKFFDNFTRANSVGLGIATDGSNWNAVNGSVNISGNQAISPNNNTNYPMTTVDMPTVNNSVELTGTSQGSSVGIWVQGSADWYLVGQDATQSSYTYSYTTSTTTSGYVYDYTSYSSYYIFSTVGVYQYAIFTSGNFHYAYAAYNYNIYASVATDHFKPYTTTTYGTAYATDTTTNYYLRLMKSVSGTVSEVTNWLLSTSSVISSFRVKTSGNTVTVQAYSDANLINQIGSDQSTTVAGATPTGRFGVSLKPSSYNQGYVIGSSVNIVRN